MDVQMPDGTIVPNVPDGATKAQVDQILRERGLVGKDQLTSVRERVPSDPMPKAPLAAPNSPNTANEQPLGSRVYKNLFEPERNPIPNEPGIVQPIDPSARILGDRGLAAFQGGREAIQGVIRLGLKALQSAGITDPATLESFEQYANQERAAYEEKMRKNFGDDAVGSFGEVGANIIGKMTLTAPVGAIKIGSGATLPSRLATGGAQGATAGAVLARPDHLVADTVTGAVAGAAIPEALRLGLQGLSKVSSWALSKKPPGSISRSDVQFGELSPDVEKQLADAGIDWQGLPQATKANVMKWVLENGDRTSLTPQEAARLGIFKGIGIDPTKAMITQKFDDFATEDMLAHQKGGDAVRDAYERINRGIGTALEDQQAMIGGATNDRSVAGLRVIDALQSGRDESRAAVTAAYKAVREDPAIGNKVSFAPVRRWFAENDAEMTASGSKQALQAGVEKWLRREGAIGPGARPLTIEKVESFKQFLNDQWNPQDRALINAIRGLQDAADEAVLKAGRGDLFETARTAHKLTKQTYDNKELISDLLAQKNPVDRKIAVEDAWDKVVLKSDVAQLMDLKNTLQKGSRVTAGPNESETISRGNAAWRDTQTSTLEWIAERARSAEKGPNDSPKFIHGKMKAAIDQIGKEKLDILFGSEGVKQLNQILEAVRLAKPISGTTNPSGSGNRIMNFFQAYMPRMFGGAAGATMGGPIGAAAGAATADAAAGAVRAAGAARKAASVTNAPEAAIAADRAVKPNLERFTPTGRTAVVVGNALAERKRRQENE